MNTNTNVCESLYVCVSPYVLYIYIYPVMYVYDRIYIYKLFCLCISVSDILKYQTSLNLQYKEKETIKVTIKKNVFFCQ